MWSDGGGVGGELGAGAAGDGDGADDDGEEGGGVATAPARALPAADVEDDGEAPSTSSASVGTVEGGATAAAAPTDSVMMVDLAATAQDFFSGTDGPCSSDRMRGLLCDERCRPPAHRCTLPFGHRLSG